MNVKPLVSIITPCYNGEHFISRYFESVLAQTYPKLELIFINDGSTDRTEEITLSFGQRLQEQGICLHYIFQENAGQAAAINKGLELFTGVYLTWPDSDDWMTPDCIEKKVDYLENHLDCGLVMCRTQCVNEINITQHLSILERKSKNPYLFDDLITETDIYFAPGGYMVRSSMFLSVCPDRHIYESRSGQNWQLLLPISYQYPCGFLNNVLYFYLIRQESHSRMETDLPSNIAKTNRHEDVLHHVLLDIDMEQGQRESYLNLIAKKYLLKRLFLAYQYHDLTLLDEEYQKLCRHDTVDFRTRLIYYRGKYRLFDKLFQLSSYPLHAIRNLQKERGKQ